jgi:hypothetical protein
MRAGTRTDSRVVAIFLAGCDLPLPRERFEEFQNSWGARSMILLLVILEKKIDADEMLGCAKSNEKDAAQGKRPSSLPLGLFFLGKITRFNHG